MLSVSVDETVDTSGANSGSGNTLALCACPGTGFFATAEGFDSTCDDGSFGGLLPLLLGSVSATTAGARAITASAIIVVGVPVAVVSAVVSTVARTITVTRARTRARTASDSADDTSQACRFADVFDWIDNRFAARRLGSLWILGVVVVVAVAATVMTRTVIVVVIIAAVHRTSATRRRILFTVLGLPEFGARREVAGDLFDAVLSGCGAVDEITHCASATAAFDVGRFGYILGLAVAMPRWCIAVLGHDGSLYPDGRRLFRSLCVSLSRGSGPLGMAC
jgi:hypothetical protein